MTTLKTSPAVHVGAKRRWSRRGVSLIEVVMAGVLLAVIASAVVGGVTTVASADARNQQKLEALELGNRLLLQYLDDKKALPSDAVHLQQGRNAYRWSLSETPIALSLPGASLIEKPENGPGAKAINKLSLVSVSVFTGVPDGTGGYAHGDRVCTLSRVCHPLSTVYRNPDSMIRITRDPSVFIEWMSGLLDDAPAGAPRTRRESAPFTGVRSTAVSHH